MLLASLHQVVADVTCPQSDTLSPEDEAAAAVMREEQRGALGFM